MRPTHGSRISRGKLAEAKRSAAGTVADLTAQLDSAKRSSAAQIADLKAKQESDSHGSTSRIADLTGKLEEVQQRSAAQVADLNAKLSAAELGAKAQIADLTSKSEASKRGSVAQVAELTEKMATLQRTSATQVADLTEKFVTIEHRAAARAQDLRQQLNTEREKSSVVVGDAAASDVQLTQAVRQQAIADDKQRLREAAPKDAGAVGKEPNQLTASIGPDVRRDVASLPAGTATAAVGASTPGHDHAVASAAAARSTHRPSDLPTRSCLGQDRQVPPSFRFRTTTFAKTHSSLQWTSRSGYSPRMRRLT